MRLYLRNQNEKITPLFQDPPLKLLLPKLYFQELLLGVYLDG